MTLTQVTGMGKEEKVLLVAGHDTYTSAREKKLFQLLP